MSLFTILVLFFVGAALNAQNDYDSDNDGMPDDWENNFSLNPLDSLDAWLDNDDDKVFNLYEFQLGTDPNVANDFTILEVTVEDDLQAAIESIDGPTVIRLAKGEYSRNDDGIFFLFVTIKLLIQGGWDETFSVYDPCSNPVILNGEPSGIIFDIFLNDQGKEAFILENINFTKANGTAIDVFGSADTSYFSINNCQFVNNESPWFSPTVNIAASSNNTITEFTVTNCFFNQNKGAEALNFGLTNPTGVTRIYNNVITNTQTTLNEDGEVRGGNGIDIGIAINSSNKVLMRNNIFWGNETDDLDFSGAREAFSLLFSSNNNVGTVADNFFPLTFPSESDISEDPIFNAQEIGDFTLSNNSPSKNTGINLGLPGQMKGSVDMGPSTCPAIVTSIFYSPKITHNLSLFPTINRGRFFVVFESMKSTTFDWEVINLQGQVINNGSLFAYSGKNKHSIEVAASSIDPGVYYFRIVSNDSYMIAPFIKK